MNDNLIIPRPLAISEVLRTCDSLIIFPDKTHNITIPRFDIPRGGVYKNFRLTDKNNIGEVSLEIGGQIIWKHTFTENETILLPFWHGLDVYDSGLFSCTFTAFCIKPRIKDEPFSLEILFTPLLLTPQLDKFKLYTRLEYIYELSIYEYLLVSKGQSLYIDSRKDMASNKEIEPEYKNRKNIITSYVIGSNPIDEYLFYVYTWNPETIQNDQELATFALVKDYAVDTAPPALDIIVESKNLEKFNIYMKKKYPNAEVQGSIQVHSIDEIKTSQLRSAEIQELKREWEKILASKDNVPKEIHAL